MHVLKQLMYILLPPKRDSQFTSSFSRDTPGHGHVYNTEQGLQTLNNTVVKINTNSSPNTFLVSKVVNIVKPQFTVTRNKSLNATYSDIYGRKMPKISK